MGYEVKMYIVIPMNPNGTNIGKFELEGKDYYTHVYNFASEDKRDYYGYLPDEVTRIDNPTERFKLTYAKVVCMVDLCKVDPFEAEEATHYFYADDGNTPIVTDRYGDRIEQLTIESMLLQLRDRAKDNQYWRYHLAIDLLEYIQQHYQHSDLLILLYGH